MPFCEPCVFSLGVDFPERTKNSPATSFDPGSSSLQKTLVLRQAVDGQGVLASRCGYLMMVILIAVNMIIIIIIVSVISIILI